MKQLFLVTALLACVLGVSAQTPVKSTLAESKLTDNWYIGLNGGLSVPKTSHYFSTSNLNSEGSLRVGRYLTPVFGLAVDCNARFDNQPDEKRGTLVQMVNTSLLATLNLSNFFGGYSGKPRRIELVLLPGMGWGRTFGTASDEGTGYNTINSTVALDLAWNIGRSRAWQVYVEPAIVYTLNGPFIDGLKYNINKSAIQVNLGFNYKLRNSNGTHNFKRVNVLNQYDMDRINQRLEELNYELREKDKELSRRARTISELKEELERSRRPVPTEE